MCGRAGVQREFSVVVSTLCGRVCYQTEKTGINLSCLVVQDRAVGEGGGPAVIIIHPVGLTLRLSN